MHLSVAPFTGRPHICLNNQDSAHIIHLQYSTKDKGYGHDHISSYSCHEAYAQLMRILFNQEGVKKNGNNL